MRNNRKWDIDVIEEITHVEGIFERVFGRLLNYLVFIESIDDSMQILEKVYWYRDIRDTFTRKVNRTDFRDLAKIIFKFQENARVWDWES